jgi:rubrerythrin
MTPLNYQQIFEIAIAAERGAQSLYLDIVQMFSSYQPAVELWTALARDEVHHARVLELIRSTFSPTALEQAVDPLLEEQVQALSRLEQKRLKASITNLDEAYQLTHELESSEINTIFEFLVHAFLPDPELETTAMQNLRDHLRRLVQAQTTLGPAEMRRRILPSGIHEQGLPS